MSNEVAIPGPNPLFRHGDLIIFSEADCVFTVPLADMLHAYKLNADPERLTVKLRIAGPWGPSAKIDLTVTGTIEYSNEVPDHLIDVDPAGSHLASTVKVLRTVDKATRVLWAEAEPWEPTAEQEPASEMFWRYCEEVAPKLCDMSAKDALHSTWGKPPKPTKSLG